MKYLYAFISYHHFKKLTQLDIRKFTTAKIGKRTDFLFIINI